MSMATKRMVLDISIFALSQVVLFFGIRWFLSSLEPGSKERKKGASDVSKIFKRLGVSPELNEHESTIAQEVIHPDDIPVTFANIAGLDDYIQDLRESVIFPLLHPQLFARSSLLQAPKGVLLYGPPGCGKTMMAKALAKESGATFINLHVSTLTEKWFGESQKLVHAVFSLAAKLSPSIIFIDEIDSFLRERRSSDHEAVGMMKAEFMSLWDGLTTGDNARVLVLGATNRPNDIDKAILRRMPKRYALKLPDARQREKVLQLLLKNIPLDPEFSFHLLALRTSHYSGSDLKELCRVAAMIPVREYIRTNPAAAAAMSRTLASSSSTVNASADPTADDAGVEVLPMRPLTLQDFLTATAERKAHDEMDRASGLQVEEDGAAVAEWLAAAGRAAAASNGSRPLGDTEGGRGLGSFGDGDREGNRTVNANGNAVSKKDSDEWTDARDGNRLDGEGLD
ncbi:hypothetical protein HDU93_009520 [Gonapodya sp. JEL0774]|nr:hypothetical protein HDU93_009520 [Gonapodya sp. JEL0774]